MACLYKIHSASCCTRKATGCCTQVNLTDTGRTHLARAAATSCCCCASSAAWRCLRRTAASACSLARAASTCWCSSCLQSRQQQQQQQRRCTGCGAVAEVLVCNGTCCHPKVPTCCCITRYRNRRASINIRGQTSKHRTCLLATARVLPCGRPCAVQAPAALAASLPGAQP